MSESEVQEGIIVQHNAMIEGSYNLSLIEQRIVRMFITGIRRDCDTNKREVVINVKDFMDMFGIQGGHSSIKNAAMKLLTRRLVIRNGYKDEQGRLWKGAEFQFVSSVKYNDNKIMITFNDEIMIFLERIVQQFTSYPIEDVIGMKSSYGIRLFELLKQYEKIGERTISIDAIRDMFGLKNKYKTTSNLYARVIKTSVEDINSHSNYIVSVQRVVNNRRLTGYKFKFSTCKDDTARLAMFIKKAKPIMDKGRHIVIDGTEVHYIDKPDKEWIAHTRYSDIPLIDMLNNSDFKFSLV